MRQETQTENQLNTLEGGEMKDIVIGKAIVCWGFKSGNYPEAWVLPGGARTMSRERAEAVAIAMNAMMK